MRGFGIGFVGQTPLGVPVAQAHPQTPVIGGGCLELGKLIQALKSRVIVV